MADAKAAGNRIRALAAALEEAGFAGEIETDLALRAAMSTDNSVYQIKPDLVVAPFDAADLVTLLDVMGQPQFADVAVTARGGGTGTNGQSLNTGVIVDLRRHMNGLIAIDEREGWADVQPGMVLDDLNEQIRETGWFFAPETSTSTRCTIGGMVNTDASGKGSRVYGKTSDNILGLQIAHPQGLLDSREPVAAWAQPMLHAAEVAARRGRSAFVANTPRLNRRFTGYDLERACADEGRFEWWRLFLGAEGTLGIVSAIRVKLRRIDREKRLIVAGFDDFRSALAAAAPLLRADPTAIEVMDETVQAIAEQAGILRRLPAALHAGAGQKVAYVFIELNGDDPAHLQVKLDDCRRILGGLAGISAIHVAGDRAEIAELWAIRSAGVGLLGKVDGLARPIAFVEDAVVPPENLPAFVDEFLDILKTNGLGFGIYGHVDVGCLHIRPALNIDRAEDRARMVAVSDAVFALTRKHGGIFWGEHGKGLRGAYLRDWIGAEAYSALQGIKAAFDPDGRFNPGKLVTNKVPIMGIATTPFRAFNAPDGDPLTLAFRCNGNAQCLSYAKTTPMCPSFKVTADIRYSPKGRADALRTWHKARREADADLPLLEKDLLETLDKCLGCKACASSCPVQVDIPSMRQAFMADYFTRHPRPLADRLVLMAERFSPAITRLAPVLAPVWPIASRIGGWLTASQDLPRHLAWLPRGLQVREEDLRPGRLPENTVIIAQDWFTALFDGAVQRQAIAGLAALGYNVRFLPMRPGGKVALNLGDTASFRSMAEALSRQLHAAAKTGLPLIAVEPAFAMMLRQDYAKVGIALPLVSLPQEFLAKEAGRRDFPKARLNKPIKLLSHCTEATALPQTGALWKKVFAAMGLEMDAPATGCCGMAGLFGHQKRHQPMSRRLFDFSWRSHIESRDIVAATGFSCRCQAKRLSGTQPSHPLGMIADLLSQ
ncbi:FAD-binding and (Fe-S)-binding domain-containing protein [Agrobacterium sp. 22-221-1]